MLTLLNSYFLFIYSSFVPDVTARYDVGWANIAVIVAIVVVNLAVISAVQGRTVCRKIKLILLRRKYK